MNTEIHSWVEITIVGNLVHRQVILMGIEKCGTLTIFSNTAGVGIMRSNKWILEYEYLKEE